MRTLVLVLAALALASVLPAPAAAQQQAVLTLALQVPESALVQDSTQSFPGYATLTTDVTAALSPTGIPVSYTVYAPAWATVVISPSSDVFSMGMVPPNGLAYSSTRSFTITVSVADGPDVDVTDLIEITAVTTPSTAFDRSVAASAQAPVTFDAPDEPCPDHAFTDAQIRQMAGSAIDAYNDHEAAKEADGSDDVTVQNSLVSPVRVASVAVAGFAILGACVGLFLRRRLQG